MLLNHRLFRFAVIFIALALCFLVYQQWAMLILWIVEAQQSFHSVLSGHIASFQENPVYYGSLLVGFSLAYGVFHAAGPGHGKAVLITYLSTQPENVKQGLRISFIAALIQSIVAIVLVSVVSIFLNQTFRQTNALGTQVELASYILVILLGVYLAGRAILGFVRSKQHAHSHNHHHVHDHQQELAHDHSHNHTHEHHECDDQCNHSYAPQEQLSVWQSASVAFSMGLRPCSGAVVVLIYANLVGVYWIGIVSTLMMGLGTGLTVAMLGWLSVVARRYLQKTVSTEHAHNHLFEQGLSLVGGVVLMVLGWSLIETTRQVVQGHPLF